MINQQKIKQIQQMQSHIGAVEINSWMFPYVLGYRDRVPFFNIEETLVATQKALNFIQHVHKEKGTILLVNTNPLFGPLVKKTALLAKVPYVNEHWIGGLLTNWQQLKYSVHAFQKFETFIATLLTNNAVAFPKYSKAKKRFEGIQKMTSSPDVLVLLQATTAHKHIIDEAKRLKIPVVSCVDSYAPNVEIEYPIPVNVNSKAFFHFLCHILVKIRNNS